MTDRRFTEIDLRGMLERATGYERDAIPERFLIKSRLRRHEWHIIVEPDTPEKLLVVITVQSTRTESMKDTYLEVTFRRGRAIAATLRGSAFDACASSSSSGGRIGV